MTAPAQWWPEEASACFADLVSYRLVGASACAGRITAALVAVGGESQSRRRDVAADLAHAANAFCDLKPDTALYRNLAGALVAAAGCGGAAAVADAAAGLRKYRHEAHEAVLRNAEDLLQDAGTVLVHDYSSVVLDVLARLGSRRRRRVVVTAGEPLGQGMRVARLVAAAGHDVTYSPDMSVGRVAAELDAFLTGVESFYGDGSLSNTVGTRMLGLLCREEGVSVIAPAETLKYDPDQPAAHAAGLQAHLLHPWPSNEVLRDTGWTAVQWVLDAVPAALVTSFVTELGVLPPVHVGARARAGLARLS